MYHRMYGKFTAGCCRMSDELEAREIGVDRQRESFNLVHFMNTATPAY